jgi:hypothetical protein
MKWYKHHEIFQSIEDSVIFFCVMGIYLLCNGGNIAILLPLAIKSRPVLLFMSSVDLRLHNYRVRPEIAWSFGGLEPELSPNGLLVEYKSEIFFKYKYTCGHHPTSFFIIFFWIFCLQVLLHEFGWTWMIMVVKRKNCKVDGYPVEAIVGSQQIQ